MGCLGGYRFPVPLLNPTIFSIPEREQTNLTFFPHSREAISSNFSIVVVSLRDSVITSFSVPEKYTIALAAPLPRLGLGLSLFTVRVSK
jgi:hypothetical protein